MNTLKAKQETFDAHKFGADLREKRIVCGLTQTDIYDLTGVAEITINRIENAKTSTTLGTLSLIANAMNCDLSVEFKDRRKTNE
jgi:transcriptional regulator with XRE-family HTH domain